MKPVLLLLTVMLLLSCCMEKPSTPTNETSTTDASSSTSTTTTTLALTTTSTTTTTLLSFGPASAVRVSGHQFAAPYTPERNYLNDEWVLIENTGRLPVNLTGWRIRNKNYRDTFIFPEFYRPGGESVKVHTGAGMNLQNDMYMGKIKAMWDDDRDTVALFDSEWDLVEKRTGFGKETYYP